LGAKEPSTEDCLRIVAELAAVNPNLLLILTGGEPLLRADLEEISRAAATAGMTVVVGTNGTLLSTGTAVRLKGSGVSGVGISLDAAARPQLHDRLRGRPGSWDDAMAGIRACKEADLDFLLQTSVFRWNRDELPALAELAASSGAKSWNVYFLVCTGRGQGLTDLTPDEYEATLHEVRQLQQAMGTRLFVTVRCAPQFRRVVAEDPAPSLPFHAYPSGCPAAWSYARIGPRGEVTPCPYMPLEAGSLEQQTLREIWEGSPLLLRLRDRQGLQGKCGRCSYRDSCGGCRARALAVLGDAMAEDPACAYQPGTPAEAASAPEPTFALPSSCTIPWSEEARARLERVPSFVRGMVVKRVEEEAHRRGAPSVTPEIMQAVRARAMPGPLSFAKPEAPTTAPQPPRRVSWTEEALHRVENAPDFVRPGIRKLMELRARERGTETITSELLSEIRDESMMRVAQMIRRFGLDELQPEAFAEARRRMSKDQKRLLVLDQIEDFLRNRGTRNEEIRRKFQCFIETAPSRGRPWLPDALARLEELPPLLRSEARRAVEEEAARIKAPVVTRGVVERTLGERRVAGNTESEAHQ
jgi:radical SAM protein with 4Fe4S-binding SPASM domain